MYSHFTILLLELIQLKCEQLSYIYNYISIRTRGPSNFSFFHKKMSHDTTIIGHTHEAMNHEC